MPYLLYVTVSTVRIFIDFLQLALCVNAIISWMPVDDENALVLLLDRICTPVLYPVRLLVEKSEMLSSLPVDISYILTYIALMLISGFLPVIAI